MGAASPVKDDARRTGIPAAAATAFLFALVCYINTLSNQFVFDDIDIISRNPLVISQPIDIAKIFTSHYWHHLTPIGDLYRPLVILTYAINHSLHGLNPAGYHIVNLLLHALCTALVVSLAGRFGLTTAGALAAGLLFASHPIHTEAVTGLVGRAELMACATVLGAMRIHLGSASPSAGRVIAVGALLLAGLLSKENAVVLPGLLLAADIWRARWDRIAWRRLLPVYALCGLLILVWLGCRSVMLDPVMPGSGYEGPFAGVDGTTRLLTALSVMSRYMILLLRPIRLSADYSYEQIPFAASWTDPLVLIAGLLLAALTIFSVHGLVAGRGSRRTALSIAIFLIAVLPVSNLLIPIGTIMGERLLYLPSVGFCLLLPSLWMSLTARAPSTPLLRHAGAVLVGALSLFYAARTVTRNTDWKDQMTLFSVTTVTSPLSAKAHYNLGVALEDAGRPDDALREYLAAVAIKSHDAKSHLNAGLLLGKMGRIEEASMHLDQASRIDPNLPQLFTNLGVVRSRLGRNEEAAAAFAKALSRDPRDAMAHYNLGTLLLMKDDPGGAIPHLESARDLNPSEPDYRFQLGLACLQAGRPGDAIAELKQALALSQDLAPAHLHLALAYLRLGMVREAGMEAQLAERAGVPLPPELERLR